MIALNYQEILIKIVDYICDKEKEYMRLMAIAKDNDDMESIQSLLKYLMVIRDIKRYILNLLEN